ncbi:MAG TPA: hypothetical protein VJ935_07185 [Acidimicrobiia bacterium]|nr:hypothetical protein [Acidimicrobiia bacterium]
MSGRILVPLAATAVGMITAAFLSSVAFRGWIPHDEGTLGQSALRILNGQWPHADFHDVYPGLLGVIHALVFEVLGVSVASLRWTWLVLAGVAAGTLFWLLQQRLQAVIAACGAIGVTITAWVIYPASMPNWWNLALGLMIVALSFHGAVTFRRSLILVAGLLTGLSILIKTTGGVLIAVPVFVWLVGRSSTSGRFRTTASVVAGLVAALLLLPAASFNRALFFGLPVAVAVLMLSRSHQAIDSPRPRIALANTFLLGTIMLPVFVIALYALTGRGASLWTGWIASPALRFEAAERDIPLNLAALILGLGVVAVGVVAVRLRIDKRLILSVASFGLVLWGFLNWTAFSPFLFGIASWAPIGLAVLVYYKRAKVPGTDLATLVMSCAFFFLLSQVPLWNGYYAAYTIPLTAAAVMLTVPRVATGVALGGLITAGVFLAHSIGGLLVGPQALDEPISYTFLENPRARIWVPEFHGYYHQLSERVAEVAATSVYAGPDAPEVAFLAAVPSANPEFFEILNPSWDSGILATVSEAGVAVVINSDPGFSARIPGDVRLMVQNEHHHREVYGKFELFWSD